MEKLDRFRGWRSSDHGLSGTVEDHTDVYTPVADAVSSLPNNGTDTSIGAVLGAVGALVGGAVTVGAVVGGAIIGAIGGYVADLENDD